MEVPAFNPQATLLAQIYPQMLQAQQLHQNSLMMPLQQQLMQQKLQAGDITNQFLPQSLQAKMALQQAQAMYNQAHAQNLPLANQLGWARLTLDQQKYNPEYLQNRNALMKMQTEHPERYASPFGKEQIEQARTIAGLLPTGMPADINSLRTNGALPAPAPMPASMAPFMNQQYANTATGAPIPASQWAPGQAPINALTQQAPQPIPAQQVQQMANQYAMKLQKSSTDVDTRKRNLYATNIEKTLSTIDPSVIAYYSGAQGKTRLAQDSALAAMGKAPPQYMEYQSVAQTKIPLLTSQVRQFYGDSIQPSVREHLEALANTSTWKDPAVAMKRFNDFTNILGSEMQTYRQALQGTGVYQGKSAMPSQATPAISQADAIAELKRRGKL